MMKIKRFNAFLLALILAFSAATPVFADDSAEEVAIDCVRGAAIGATAVWLGFWLLVPGVGPLAAIAAALADPVTLGTAAIGCTTQVLEDATDSDS